MHHISQLEAPHTDRNDLQNIKTLLPLLWEYRGRVLLALSCLIVAKLANVGIPLVLKDIVDHLDHQTEQLILPITLLLAYGLLKLSSSLFNELRDAIFARIRYRAMRRLSVKVIKHLFSLSLNFHLERQTGAITRDLERGTSSLSSIMNYMIFSILPTLAEFLLVATILLLQYDIWFAVVTFATVTIYTVFTLMVTEWRMHFRLEMNEKDSKANSQAVDGLINYETVKYFNNDDFEISRYDKTLASWEKSAVNSQVSMSALNFGQGAIIAVGITIIMMMATQGVVNGNMSIGDLVLVNAFLLQLFIPLNFLGIVYRQMKYSFADMDLMIKLLKQKQDITDIPNAKDLNVSHGEITFNQVNFSYQTERSILNDVSFTVKAGQKIAIVGSSGAGKSTIVRLLYRFYDLNQGSIQIDQQDISQITQDSLRQSIGVVPQDTVLFNNSIYYNLLYAKTDATEQDIKNAAKMAHIHQFILSLPKGYDTIVGERGLKLSGGEKQRMAIARAILKKPKILLFDEATSSLDSKTEQAIQQTLKEVAVNHTTIVVAHRLSTITDADQILVMSQGSIVEQGTHHELLSLNGSYANLWQIQQES
ncbi:MAG: ABC transporter ATP-binding protein/permease [Methylococcales bacterium]|jgi:ATP-binding cassette, subfamily B, heavy metal transporter|nr:ABC transporter ATP-binding protein/permease [Methylococcales bacterium]